MPPSENITQRIKAAARARKPVFQGNRKASPPPTPSELQDIQAARRWYEHAMTQRIQLQEDGYPMEDDEQGPYESDLKRLSSADYDELRTATLEKYPPGKPKHAQMKAKTDGETIFVRKSDLLITFHNVRRIASENRVHEAPTRNEQLEVLPVGMYSEVFADDMNGVFIPMKLDSALRICFESREKHSHNPYMIRIYAGKVNVISGRTDFEKGDSCVQDYIVVPDQKFIDGFALNHEKARQFLAPQQGPGFSFDWPWQQARDGKPVFSSLRFEITPFEFEDVDDFFIRGTGWQDRQLMLPIKPGDQVQIPARVEKYFGIDANLIKWKCRDRKFPDGKSTKSSQVVQINS